MLIVKAEQSAVIMWYLCLLQICAEWREALRSLWEYLQERGRESRLAPVLRLGVLSQGSASPVPPSFQEKAGGVFLF